MTDSFPMYTVYQNPSDYPGKFVARRFDIVAGQREPRVTLEPLAVSGSLDAVRLAIREAMPHGVRMHRMSSDAPDVIETWI